MTTSSPSYTIDVIAKPSARILGERVEANQLTYGPSELLVARAHATDDEIIGAVRCAMRVKSPYTEGIITDLQVDDDLRDTGLPEALITAAEARLRARGAEKIDGLLLDGLGMAPYFYRMGYWSSRRTVVLAWDLTTLRDIPIAPEYRIERVDRPDPEEIGNFILGSYQPYFRWWKERREAQKWFRVELQSEDHAAETERIADEVRQRVIADIARAGTNGPQTFFLAYRDDTLVGLCDAREGRTEDDTFEWCVLVNRQGSGLGLGSSLLGCALRWLRDERGLTGAEYTSTSGLDDYDPLIYLSTVSTGAFIKGEFLDCIKTNFA